MMEKYAIHNIRMCIIILLRFKSSTCEWIISSKTVIEMETHHFFSVLFDSIEYGNNHMASSELTPLFGIEN